MACIPGESKTTITTTTVPAATASKAASASAAIASFRTAAFIGGNSASRAANGKCPRVTEHNLAELRADLPQDFAGTIEAGEIEFRPRGAANGWRYHSPDAKPTACNLSHKLSWDPELVWLRHGA